MSDRKQVIVRVSEDRKEQWDEYADQTNRTLSGLIRRAVEQEIASDDERSAGRSEDLSGQLSEVVENLQRIDNRLETFDTRLRTVEQEVKTDEELTDLVNDVYSLLPESEDEIMEAEHQARSPGEVPPEQRARSGRVEDIATALEAETYRVQDALDKLQQDTHRVQTTELAGEARYYKEV